MWFYNLVRSPKVSGTDKIVCPLHDDINPSLQIDYETGRWNCFGCAAGGDALSFVQKFEAKYSGLSGLKAAIKFNKILNSTKASDVKMAPNYRSAKAPRQEILDASWNYFYGLRKVNWKNVELDEEREAKQYMAERGFTSRSLTAADAKVTFNKQYQLIFPMLDNGEFKGWVCRTTDPEIAKTRKYLYNKGFSRATTLVGNYNYKLVYVVEGYIDWLRFRECGIKNVVAILGWKMSHEQIEKLKAAGVQTVVSALDNDECGRKGTKYLRQFFNVIRFAYMKGIKDPGEMNKQQFERMVNKTKLNSKQNGGNKNGTN